MAWLNTSGNTNQANYFLISKESEDRILREELIPVGYTLETYLLDANGNRVQDADGNDVRVTQFHQTGTVRIACKVRITTTVEEWRAVDESTASSLSGGALGGVTISNNMTGHTFTQGNAWVDVPDCNGTIVKVKSFRANAAGAWTVQKTTIESTPL